MDVVARTVDLSRAIVDILNKETSIRNAAEEILEWLGRERIDKQEYQYCIEALRAQAFPNCRGLDIKHQVQSSEEKVLSVAGLRLKLSTSIGRWMLNDSNFIYVVTTVAVCMMYHDMAYAVEVLCNLAMDQSDHTKGVSYHRSHYRVRLKPVVTKFVDSIALNVVNAGHDLCSAFPNALKGVCSHPLDAPQLSAIIKAVSVAQSDMIITCDLFPGDLAMWLLTHFHGVLEISLNGTVVFEEQSGTDPWRVILVVYNKCSVCPNQRGDFKKSNIKVATIVEGTHFTIINENYCFNQETKPSTRQKLYENDLLAHWQRGILSRNEVAQLRIAAKSMLLWLLQLRICISEQNPVFVVSQENVACREDVGGSTDATHKIDTFENMLAGYPTILHKNWGEIGGSNLSTVYEPPQEHQENDSEEEMQQTSPMSIAQILECFPVVSSVFDLVQQRCTCSSCKSAKPLGSCSLGCLREAALHELLLLITHGITEAFGARDVSGLWDPNAVRDAVREVFEDIIRYSTLQWDRWFRLVALVYLGGSFNKIPSSSERSGSGEDSSATVAYQRGSLVIAAAWLDFSSDLSACRAFRAEFGEGQIRGISSEEAEVELEPGISLDALSNFQLHEPSDEDLTEWDDGMCLVESALISTGDRSYRLLTMLRSTSHRRLIDPFNAILGLFRSRYPKCAHPHPQRVPILQPGKELHLATFDHVVGTLGINPGDVDDPPERRPNTIRVTQLLDTVKSNVILSLSPEGTVIVESCCLSCACGETDRLAAPPYVIRKAPYNSKALKTYAAASI
ncbi:hypothetical protein BKA67DRAFT_659331 [Truncatella angustata]|uniref:Uncharacterized protein n=1 Tax=Truncatella angustata TaxID=152316 RepID=A0A9P8ZW56_9PEZI|nr:uncharacterized protein BKA67DRAFT_659331 [Truncatella angustata]KAH6652637.1 hypothetical protein BKA67DRAFT_659331 [Truncatella angustata]